MSDKKGTLHEKIEKNVGLMAILIVLVISVGGLVEIVPLMFKASVVEPAEGVQPYGPLELAGRDVYVAEGCYNCHSQQIRPFRAETERYGHYSVAGEHVYDRPFQWGSKRTGPDLARVGGLYSDDWHYLHMMDPRAVVPGSNMPAYPWLAERYVDPEVVQRRMRALRRIGTPYSDEDIEGAVDAVVGRTEMDAIIAYLQSLGTEWTGQHAAADDDGGDS
jgi:cytochrome c oxidase cbb3-type subunit II